MTSPLALALAIHLLEQSRDRSDDGGAPREPDPSPTRADGGAPQEPPPSPTLPDTGAPKEPQPNPTRTDAGPTTTTAAAATASDATTRRRLCSSPLERRRARRAERELAAQARSPRGDATSPRLPLEVRRPQKRYLACLLALGAALKNRGRGRCTKPKCLTTAS